ncbi:MAG: hypothetical protein ACYTAF_15500 [Planctomycetota bacterium]|jgi:hypothetical protein
MNVRKCDINPDNAEGYLYRARRVVESLDEPARTAARENGARLLEGLFRRVDRDLPVSREARVDLAAFEWLSAGGSVSTALVARIKRALLNVGVARVFEAVGARLKSRRRKVQRKPDRDASGAAA